MYLDGVNHIYKCAYQSKLTYFSWNVFTKGPKGVVIGSGMKIGDKPGYWLYALNYKYIPACGWLGCSFLGHEQVLDCLNLGCLGNKEANNNILVKPSGVRNFKSQNKYNYTTKQKLCNILLLIISTNQVIQLKGSTRVFCSFEDFVER